MTPLPGTIGALLILEVVISSQQTRAGPSDRVVLPLCPDNMRLTDAFTEHSLGEK